MNDAGLIGIFNRLLDAKTKKEGDAIVADTGVTYRAFAQRLLDRLTFKRTNDQNSLYYKWISEIARQQGETQVETRRTIKLIHGCKILCRDDKDFLAFCQKALKRLTYEEVKEAMDYVSVSSLMTTKQMTEYMDEIEKHYRSQGVVLTLPEAA